MGNRVHRGDGHQQGIALGHRERELGVGIGQRVGVAQRADALRIAEYAAQHRASHILRTLGLQGCEHQKEEEDEPSTFEHWHKDSKRFVSKRQYAPILFADG